MSGDNSLMHRARGVYRLRGNGGSGPLHVHRLAAGLRLQRHVNVAYQTDSYFHVRSGVGKSLRINHHVIAARQKSLDPELSTSIDCRFANCRRPHRLNRHMGCDDPRSAGVLHFTAQSAVWILGDQDRGTQEKCQEENNNCGQPKPANVKR